MLPKEVRERLASEFRIAADAVKNSADLPSKIYFFSVFHGEPQRQFNIHWDRDLNLLFMVVSTAIHEMQTKPQVPSLPNSVERLPIGYLEALDEVSEELASIIEADEIGSTRFYAALGRVGELGYTVTGNGYYLYLKGMIKIADPSEQPPPSPQSHGAAQDSVSRPAPARRSSRRTAPRRPQQDS